MLVCHLFRPVCWMNDGRGFVSGNRRGRSHPGVHARERDSVGKYAGTRRRTVVRGDPSSSIPPAHLPFDDANAIVTATQIALYQKMQPVDGFFVRPEQKQHGTQRLIEGNPPQEQGARVVIVEDTISTGSSIRRAIEAVEAAGCTVAKVLLLVDRKQGGSEALRADGYDVVALFEADDEGRIV